MHWFTPPPDPPKWSDCAQRGHIFRYRFFDWWWAPRRCINCGELEP